MMDDNKPKLSGEARLAARRRKFWLYFTLAMLVSVTAGFASGLASKLYQNGTIPLWLPIAAIVAVVAGMIWATWQYFRRIDEIDLMDNLWAHTIGLYAGVLAYLAWFLLADMEIVRTPSAMAIVFFALLSTGIAYGLRKLNFR
ncbi:hypothetical protein [Aurantiacibacter marinus]|uniref:Uncharacterized protein n=1 Tax=Aurantiacibacter marinus TaxID=874156 RepID=A0A0H0XPI8_9SPHN|nr:hypothetical protein [Aurantiacibacter marinus]KLI63916.1 hypothetical protein AAV99_09485 [Aurantiacibacter marinus]